ncbi:MAG TPA: DUF937 domain-containing protein [Lysobacter sp.]|nr:DUF937 domain-containing protein [Lysobacter sp.]
MNGPLLDDLLDQLRGEPMRRLSENLGVSRDTAAAATDVAMRVLIGATHHAALDDDGARSLLATLEFDHRGIDPSNALATALAGGTQGETVLDRVLHGHRASAVEGVAAASGLDAARSDMLLRALAPVVMAYLARRLFTPAEADGASTPHPSPEGLRAALAAEVDGLRDRDAIGMTPHSDSVAGMDAPGLADDGLAPLPVQTAEMRSPRPRI